MSEVYVVTGTELGWDCVVDVFKTDDVSYAQLEALFGKDSYVIHGPILPQKDTGDWDE